MTSFGWRAAIAGQQPVETGERAVVLASCVGRAVTGRTAPARARASWRSARGRRSAVQPAHARVHPAGSAPAPTAGCRPATVRPSTSRSARSQRGQRARRSGTCPASARVERAAGELLGTSSVPDGTRGVSRLTTSPLADLAAADDRARFGVDHPRPGRAPSSPGREAARDRVAERPRTSAHRPARPVGVVPASERRRRRPSRRRSEGSGHGPDRTEPRYVGWVRRADRRAPRGRRPGRGSPAGATQPASTARRPRPPAAVPDRSSTRRYDSVATAKVTASRSAFERRAAEPDAPADKPDDDRPVPEVQAVGDRARSTAAAANDERRPDRAPGPVHRGRDHRGDRDRVQQRSDAVVARVDVASTRVPRPDDARRAPIDAERPGTVAVAPRCRRVGFQTEEQQREQAADEDRVRAGVGAVVRARRDRRRRRAPASATTDAIAPTTHTPASRSQRAPPRAGRHAEHDERPDQVELLLDRERPQVAERRRRREEVEVATGPTMMKRQFAT